MSRGILSCHHFIMSICQCVVTLYFTALHMPSSLIAPIKSLRAVGKKKQDLSIPMSQIFYTVTHSRHLATLYRCYVVLLIMVICLFVPVMHRIYWICRFYKTMR